MVIAQATRAAASAAALNRWTGKPALPTIPEQKDISSS
jgi:hypothetical protein